MKAFYVTAGVGWLMMAHDLGGLHGVAFLGMASGCCYIGWRLIKEGLKPSVVGLLAAFAVLAMGSSVTLAQSVNGWPQAITWTNGVGGSIYCSNNVRPVRFEPDYGDPITNIVINADFKGTIQVGTNFFLQNQGVFALVANQEATAEWLESPVTLHAERDGPNSWAIDSILHNWTDPETQLGLRSDGMVIWRKRP